MLAKSILLLVLPLTVLGGVLEPRAIPWGTPSRPYRDGPGDVPGRLPPPVRAQPARANTAPPPPTVEPVKKPTQRKNAGTQQADVHRMSEGNSIALFNGKPVDPNTGNLIIKNTNEKRALPAYQSANGQIHSLGAEEPVDIYKTIPERHFYPALQLANGQVYTTDEELAQEAANPAWNRQRLQARAQKRDLRKKLNLDFLSDPDTDEDAMRGHLRSGGVGQFQAPGTDRRPIDYSGYSDPAYAAYQPYPSHQKSTAHAEEEEPEEELAEEQDEEIEELPVVEPGPEQIEWKGRSITVFNGQPVQGAAKKKALDILAKRGLDSTDANLGPNGEVRSAPLRETVEFEPYLMEDSPHIVKDSSHRRKLFMQPHLVQTVQEQAVQEPPVHVCPPMDPRTVLISEVDPPHRRIQTRDLCEEPKTLERRDHPPTRYYLQHANGQVYDIADGEERNVEKPKSLERRDHPTTRYYLQHANGQVYDIADDEESNVEKPKTVERRDNAPPRCYKQRINGQVYDGSDEDSKVEPPKSVERRDNAPARYYLQHPNGQVYDGAEEKTLEKRAWQFPNGWQFSNGQFYANDEERNQEPDLPDLHARDFKSRLRNNGSGRKKGVSDNSEPAEESEDIEDSVARAPEPVAEPTLEDLANGQSFVIRNGVPIEAGKTNNVRVKKPRPAFPARGGQVDSSVVKRSTNAEAAPGKKIPNLNPFGRNPITRNQGKDSNSNATEKTNGNTNSETTIGEARVVRSPSSQENEHVKVNKGKDYVLFNGQPVSVGGAKGGESAAKSMPGLAGRVGPL